MISIEKGQTEVGTWPPFAKAFGRQSALAVAVNFQPGSSLYQGQYRLIY